MQVSYILSPNWKYLLQIPCNPNLTKVEQQGLYLPNILPLNLEQTKLETINEKYQNKFRLPKINKQNNLTLWIKVGMTSQVSQTEKNGCHTEQTFKIGPWNNRSILQV